MEFAYIRARDKRGVKIFTFRISDFSLALSTRYFVGIIDTSIHFNH